MNKQSLLKELEAVGMRPGRGLGQNFLLDNNLLEAIIRTNHPAASDRILEVGPGFGALTEKLLATGAEVTAVEFDHRLADYLRKKFAAAANFRLVEADACKVNYDQLFPNVSYRAIANLPYAISSVFMIKLLESVNKPEMMYFMLQKEMGERLAALPGTKQYGALSVRLQACYRTVIDKIVPPQVFYPAPKVESALVSFAKLPELPNDGELQMLGRIVKKLFNQRRKQIGKVLAAEWAEETVKKVLDQTGIPPESRPDNLSVEDFLRLTRTLEKEL